MSRAALLATVGVALRTNLRRLTTWVFAAVFVLIALLLYGGALAFGGMTATGVKLAVNSDYVIALVLAAYSFMLMHFTATLNGDPVVVDRRLGLAPILRATPTPARVYLLGRFLGGYLSVSLLYAIFVAALVLGQLLPGDDTLVLPLRIWPYLEFGLLFVFVSTFFVGALSFALATLTGSMKPAYIAVTALLVGWYLMMRLMGDEQMRTLAYWEPSGLIWLVEKVARSRGNAWLNEHGIAPDAGLLINRLVLVLLGAAALVHTLRRYPKLEEAAGEADEIRPGPLVRLQAWLRGRQPLVEDRYRRWSGGGDAPRLEPAQEGPELYAAQLLCSLRTELRLLRAERSLWIMIPMIMLLSGVWAYTFAGPFNLPIYPVSSEFAQQMVGSLMILLAGTTIFYTGEAFHRDQAHGLRSIIYATPVPNSALLLGKLGAMLILSIGMVLCTYLTGVVSQAIRWLAIDGRLYLDLVPYREVGLRVVLPSVAILCALALVVNVLVRGRYLAYFSLIGLGALYVWLLTQGRRDLVHNPLLVGHWSYSDMTRLEPFGDRLALHHLYWACVTGGLLALATWLLARRRQGPLEYFRPRRLRRRPGAAIATLAFLLVALLVGRHIQARSNLRGTEDEVQDRQVELEQSYLHLLEEPRVAFRSVDLGLRLWPEQGALDVQATIELGNPYPVPIETAWFTVDPLFEIRRFEIDREAAPWRRDDALLWIPLDPPLLPGERALLHVDWSGRPQPGIPRDGGAQATFVHRSAVMLNSYAPHLLPVPGLAPYLFLLDPEEREDRGLAELELLRDRSGEAFVPTAFGSDTPYELEIRIDAPARLTAIAGGQRVHRRVLGDRAVTTWRSDAPVSAFAVLAAEYERAVQGDDEVYYHARHTYNLDTVLEALRDSRRVFARSFGPYPHRQLRIVEFPRLASFAQSFPTTMPYSESIGFLTNHREAGRFIDATYFVTAHEVAHQWWGYVVEPGASLGAQVLSESLAEYSAMLVMDETRGERERLVFLKSEEDAYIRRRDPDRERALAELAYEGAYAWYNKGSMVFYMLERQIGRPALVGALRRFADAWRSDRPGAEPSHPTLPDLLAELRRAHPSMDLEWFYETWFQEVVIPDMALKSAELLRDPDGFRVEVVAENRGQGRLPVRVEATRGRWDLAEDGQDWNRDFQAGEPITLWLEPGQEARGTLLLDFEPEEVILDRLFECLDFDRTNNRMPLEAAEPERPLASSRLDHGGRRERGG